MKYGYARVSTTDQKLENQVDLLNDAGAEKIFQEKFTGTTTDRPQFSQLIAQLEKGDTLIVTKLDRFARNTREALEIIQTLFARGVVVNILNMGKIDNTPTGQLVFTIFSAFAQFERDMIVSRTQEGKEYARAHDPQFHEGHPQKYNEDQITLAFELHAQGMTHKMIERKTGISISTQKRRFKTLSESGNARQTYRVITPFTAIVFDGTHIEEHTLEAGQMFEIESWINGDIDDYSGAHIHVKGLGRLQADSPDIIHNSEPIIPREYDDNPFDLH